MNRLVNIPEGARLIIPSTFADCLSYGEQVRFLYEKLSECMTEIEELKAANSADVVAELQEIRDDISSIKNSIDNIKETLGELQLLHQGETFTYMYYRPEDIF